MPLWGFPSKKPKQTAKKKDGPAYQRRAKARAVKNAQDESGETQRKLAAKARRITRLRG